MNVRSVYTDEIGRMYCGLHRRDLCHECFVQFFSENEQAEVAAGLRPAKSAAQVLAEGQAMIEQDLRFLGPNPMLEELEYHQGELNRALRQAKQFVGDEKAEYEAALLKAREKSRGHEADVVALARRVRSLGLSNRMEGADVQQLYEQFAAPSPAAKRDVNVDPFTCSYCRTIKTERMPCCSRCKKMAYCSRECQKTHWKAHKKDCVPVEKLSKKDSKDLPLTWEQLEEFGQVTEGLKLQVRFIDQEPGLRLVALCKDRVGVTKRVAAYTDSRTIPGFQPGKIMEWKNPRFHDFLDGSSGARIEEADLPNIKVK